MTDDELIARADRNYFESFRALAQHTAGGEALDRDGVLIIKTGVPIARFNLAFVTRPLADPAAAIADAIGYFDALKLPFVVRLREGLDEAAERAAEAQGLPYRDTVPGMVLPRIGVIPDSPKELAISAVHDAATLDDHLQVLVASFGMPMDLARRLLTLRTLSAPKAEFYVGYVDGEPVASSALIATDGTAGVWNVGCMPSHRRRGIGEAMTSHAVRRGAEIGCDIANLQASEMGQPVYERMGFRTVAPYKTFVRDGY